MCTIHQVSSLNLYFHTQTEIWSPSRGWDPTETVFLAPIFVVLVASQTVSNCLKLSQPMRKLDFHCKTCSLKEKFLS